MKRLGWLWGHFSTGWWRTIFLYLPDKQPSQIRANKYTKQGPSGVWGVCTCPQTCVTTGEQRTLFSLQDWSRTAAGEIQPNWLRVWVHHELSGFHQVTNNKPLCINWPMPLQKRFCILISYSSLYGLKYLKTQLHNFMPHYNKVKSIFISFLFYFMTL